MEFKKITLLSKKINKEIELEIYTDKDGINIITTNSLKKAFEEIKAEFGIKDSFKYDIITENGKIVYVTVDWTLEDKNGYCSTYTGESMYTTLTNDIARNYPKTIALNRAQSAGIIAYLQLPGKNYSDTQIPNDEKKINSEGTISIPSEEKQNAETKKNTGKMTEQPVITGVPELKECDITIPIELSEKDVEINVGNEEPDNNSTNTNEENSDKKDNVINSPSSGHKNSDRNNSTNSTITENTFVGLGRFEKTTIKEFISLYKEGNELAVKFYNVCIKDGKLSNKNSQNQAVMGFIKKQLNT